MWQDSGTTLRGPVLGEGPASSRRGGLAGRCRNVLRATMRDVAEAGVVRHPSGVLKMSRLWTEEEDHLLREICASGDKVASPQIAIRISETFSISPPLTRAAVVGRARRLKIKLPIDRPRKLEAKPTPQHNALSIPLRRVHEPDRRARARASLMPNLPKGLGVFLLNSSDLDCKRPLAGRGAAMIVCGAPVVRRPYAGVGYCEECLRLMLTPETHQALRGSFVLPYRSK